jgi:hypothetical protein
MKKQFILSVIYHVVPGKARELLRSLKKGNERELSDRGEEGFKAGGFLGIKRDAMIS